uniref:Nop domain-containing protein n=1 Tax=Phaeocystis antarctica TaxID=33657 RepID=A0A7S0NG10_9EUKA|mmetsp:Transcript_7918/g.18569  ORF Transcript_7918/g.18569 Transcript_7918/m.18569 type:complete len:507 (+) Transcript_7918:59-1579(+)
MLVLFDSPAGHCLFKVMDSGLLKKPEDIWDAFTSAESAKKAVKLKAFHKFEDTAEAVQSATALVEGKLSAGMKKFLKKSIVSKELQETLAVADAKLGGAIKEKLGIACIHDESALQLTRGLRNQIESLVEAASASEMKSMAIGLAHSLSRYKLKFSPDKVDTMIVQAIGLLDDLDKELNTYAMRLREWYGWHFPELGKIVPDHQMYAKALMKMGVRTSCKSLDFSDILPEEVELEMKDAAEISMGTEVSEDDIANILQLCDQVVSLSEYRAQLWDYLRNRMQAIAPNLTTVVGELVGARLIAHAGSLMNLAKQPASTVQILGAEKALFRALKTKHDTPKYGLIYHASLVGQAEPKHKGKISRVLAAKCALSIRVDALGDTSEPTVGYEGRLKVEERLRQLQGKAPIPKEEVKLAVKQPKVAMAADAKAGGYSTAGDAVLDGKKAKKEKKAEAGDDEAAKKAAKKAKKAAAAAAGENGDAEAGEKKKKKRDKDDDEEKPKKKKKSKE